MADVRKIKLDRDDAPPHLEIKVGQNLAGSYSIDLVPPGGAPKEIGKGNTENPDGNRSDVFLLPGTPEQLAGARLDIYTLLYPLNDQAAGRYHLSVSVNQEDTSQEEIWAGDFEKSKKSFIAYIELTI